MPNAVAQGPRTHAARSLVATCLSLGLFHSLVMFLALAPVGWWPCAFLAPLGPFVAAMRLGAEPSRRARVKGVLAVWAGCVPFWAFTEWWIVDVSAAGYPFLVFIEAFWPAFFAWLAGAGVARWPRVPAWLLLAPAWAGVEFFRGELFANGYAWGLVAYPLIDAPVLAAAATVGGVYLVSLLACVPAAAVIDARVGRRAWSIVGVMLWVAATVAGWASASSTKGTGVTVRIAAIQTNVPQSNKLAWSMESELADYAKFEAMTEAAAKAGPDVIVWPETMMPGVTLEPGALEELRSKGVFHEIRGAAGPRRIDADHFAVQVKALSRRIGTSMLVGEDAQEGFRVVPVDEGLEFRYDRRYNSVYLLRGGETSDVRYDKVRLTPFGETMPYISSVPWLERALLDFGARGMRFDLDAGEKETVFELARTGGGTFRAATPICFEVTVAPHVRRLVAGHDGTRRADVIINVTNDGWFGSFTPARLQHLQIARWRSLELATPMVRAANTGISCAIDRAGRVREAGPVGAPSPALTEGVMPAVVELPGELTMYAKVGDVAGWAALAWLAPLMWAALRRRPAAREFNA
ncbi:MAG: apolipoprotein N-acyltransferase [Phycisphaerae bacterium]